jgi:hypothetical protein
VARRQAAWLDSGADGSLWRGPGCGGQLAWMGAGASGTRSGRLGMVSPRPVAEAANGRAPPAR